MSNARDMAGLSSVNDRLSEVGNSDGALSNRNMLLNGSFRVSQRGDYTSVSTMTHNVYMLDRWKNAAGVASTIQDLGGYVEIKAAAASGGSTVRISQLIEDLYLLEGQTVTVSCEMKSNSSNGRLMMHNGAWVAADATHTGNGEWESLSFTVTMPDSLTVTSVQVGIDGNLSSNVPISVGDYVQIKNVQLEVGDQSTPFEHRSYSDQLQSCQRYFQRSVQTVGSGFAYGDADVATANCVNSNWLMDNLGFKATMRANPSFRNSGGAGALGSVMRSQTGGNISLGLTCKLDGEVRAFPGGNVSAYESVQFSWDADAEL